MIVVAGSNAEKVDRNMDGANTRQNNMIQPTTVAIKAAERSAATTTTANNNAPQSATHIPERGGMGNKYKYTHTIATYNPALLY